MDLFSDWLLRETPEELIKLTSSLGKPLDDHLSKFFRETNAIVTTLGSAYYQILHSNSTKADIRQTLLLPSVQRFEDKDLSNYRVYIRLQQEEVGQNPPLEDKDKEKWIREREKYFREWVQKTWTPQWLKDIIHKIIESIYKEEPEVVLWSAPIKSGGKNRARLEVVLVHP